MTKRLWPLAALALCTLLVGGCSNAPADNSDSGTSTPTTTKTATSRGKAVQFAACMRENGVDEFPDPDASGELTIDGVLNGSSLDSDAPAWKQAIAACKDLQPSGFTGHERSAKEQSASLEFAQCIREHGVKDFPDPAEGQPLVDTNRIPFSSNQPGGMTILNAAMKTCGDLAAAAMDGR